MLLTPSDLGKQEQVCVFREVFKSPHGSSAKSVSTRDYDRTFYLEPQWAWVQVSVVATLRFEAYIRTRISSRLLSSQQLHRVGHSNTAAWQEWVSKSYRCDGTTLFRNDLHADSLYLAHDDVQCWKPHPLVMFLPSVCRAPGRDRPLLRFLDGEACKQTPLA